MNIREFSSVNDRRMALEQELGVLLPQIGSSTLGDTLGVNHCENMIGTTQVPMGVAGPLTISPVNHESSTHYYVPLATTEGALVASVSRGCKTIVQSGGAKTESRLVGVSRGPVFEVASIQESRLLADFVENNLSELQKVAMDTSSHLRLLSLSTTGVGKQRYVRFVFDTEDAMGMNMATIATEQLVIYIESHTKARCIAISGNFCVDKKPSWQNMIAGRGREVSAEVVLSKDILAGVLKTTATAMERVWIAKCMIGSAITGSLGFNAQYANVIAALFLATGQDLGHIGEGSMGITTVEKTADDGLYVSVYLPNVMIGTVGGGTSLPTQKEALSLLGVAGGNSGKNAQKFSEILGAAVLAGEISLLASLAEGTLVCAHKQLGRGAKV